MLTWYHYHSAKFTKDASVSTHVTLRWLHASQFWWVAFQLSWMMSCDLGQPNWCCICIATSSNQQILRTNLFLQNIVAGRQQQKPTLRRFLIPILKPYFPDETVIGSCLHRNEIPGFSVCGCFHRIEIPGFRVVVALSGSVETCSMTFHCKSVSI